jgi:hypothetical protein
MKTILATILLSFIFLPNSIHENFPVEKKNIKLEIVLNGLYKLPQEQINSNEKNDYNFFLVTLILKNQSDSLVNFTICDCASGANIVSESPDVLICSTICSRNGFKVIPFKPNQELSLPTILQVHKNFKIDNLGLRLGFILIDIKELNKDKLAESFEEYKKSYSHIIWTKPFSLYMLDPYPFSIR